MTNKENDLIKTFGSGLPADPEKPTSQQSAEEAESDADEAESEAQAAEGEADSAKAAAELAAGEEAAQSAAQAAADASVSAETEDDKVAAQRAGERVRAAQEELRKAKESVEQSDDSSAAAAAAAGAVATAAEEAHPGLGSLPRDMVETILSSLGPRDLARFGMTDPAVFIDYVSHLIKSGQLTKEGKPIDTQGKFDYDTLMEVVGEWVRDVVVCKNRPSEMEELVANFDRMVRADPDLDQDTLIDVFKQILDGSDHHLADSLKKSLTDYLLRLLRNGELSDLVTEQDIPADINPDVLFLGFLQGRYRMIVSPG